MVRDVIERAGLSLSDLGTIAVSIGPGSYSGIRIGASTALGLKNALGVDCRGVSILEAMAYGSSASELITAVQVGKNDVAWQRFEISSGLPSARSEPCLTPLSELEDSLKAVDFCGPRALLERIRGVGRTYASDEAATLAALVGRYALALPNADERLQPIYLRSGTGF